MSEIKVGDRVRVAPTALMKLQHPEILGPTYTVTEVRSDGGLVLDSWLIGDDYQLEVIERSAR